MPMYASKYVFGQSFFAAWLVISIIWLWGTLIVVGFYPIIDGWRQIGDVFRAIKAGGWRKAETKREGSESASGNDTPLSEGKVG